MPGPISHSRVNLPGGNVFHKPDGMGSGGKRVYHKPQLASISLELPIPCDELTPGEWQCLNYFAKLSHNVESSPRLKKSTSDRHKLEEIKTLMLECFRLRSGLRDPADAVIDSCEDYMQGVFISFRLDPLQGLHLFFEKLFGSLSSVQTYLEIKSEDDKIAYVLPSLTSAAEWKYYSDQNKKPGEISIEAETENDKSTVMAAIKMIQEDEKRAGATTYSRFLGKYAGRIQVVTGADYAHAEYRPDRPIVIGDSIVTLGPLEVSSVLLHEAEHHRFEDIVRPLIEFRVLKVETKTGINVLRSSDIGGVYELEYLSDMLHGVEIEQEDGELFISPVFLERKLLTEMFARYRELDAARLSMYPERVDVFHEIDLLEKAVSCLFHIDPIIKKVMDRYAIIRNERQERRKAEGRVASPQEALARLLEALKKSE